MNGNFDLAFKDGHDEAVRRQEVVLGARRGGRLRRGAAAVRRRQEGHRHDRPRRENNRFNKDSL